MLPWESCASISAHPAMSSMAPSPTIAIPKKTTDDVDWTSPIRSLIAQSYGESPENYAAECAMLQRCRQDAVRGAGSELTGEQMMIYFISYSVI